MIWSWILSAAGITGLALSLRGHRHGWKIGVATQVLWISYAVATRQWGFVPASLCYGAVYVTQGRKRRHG